MLAAPNPVTYGLLQVHGQNRLAHRGRTQAAERTQLARGSFITTYFCCQNHGVQYPRGTITY